MARLLGALPDRFPSDSVSWASDVNKNVIRAGDVQLRADFHIVQGRLCGRRGLIDRALRHLDLARSLLQDDPSQGLEAVLHLDASALLGLASDYQESLARARMALACATASGHLRTHAAALANLGQILVYLGQFGDASTLLKDTLTLAHGSREIRAACLDTLAQLQLSLGDWHSSEDLLCRAQEALPTSDEFAPSWYELLMQQTRIRLALKKGHHGSANPGAISRPLPSDSTP